MKSDGVFMPGVYVNSPMFWIRRRGFWFEGGVKKRSGAGDVDVDDDDDLVAEWSMLYDGSCELLPPLAPDM
jgi:hypothetical protein